MMGVRVLIPFAAIQDIFRLFMQIAEVLILSGSVLISLSASRLVFPD